MGIRPEVIDLKGWVVVELTEEKLATLTAATFEFEKNSKDPNYFGVENFDGDVESLRADLKTLPCYQYLHLQVGDYDNFDSYCGLGWKHFSTKSFYNPKAKDLKKLKTILEKHGFVVDERIENDRYTYMG